MRFMDSFSWSAALGSMSINWYQEYPRSLADYGLHPYNEEYKPKPHPYNEEYSYQVRYHLNTIKFL